MNSPSDSILIASDHAGFELKEYLKSQFSEKHLFEDLGTLSKESVDYPDYADALASRLNSNVSSAKFGILICGSGVGVCIRANRYLKVRAVQVWNADIARLCREHNDANVICFGERAQSKEDCARYLDIFLSTAFLGDNATEASAIRHLSRVKKLSAPTK